MKIESWAQSFCPAGSFEDAKVMFKLGPSVDFLPVDDQQYVKSATTFTRTTKDMVETKLLWPGSMRIVRYAGLTEESLCLEGCLAVYFPT